MGMIDVQFQKNTLLTKAPNYNKRFTNPQGQAPNKAKKLIHL